MATITDLLSRGPEYTGRFAGEAKILLGNYRFLLKKPNVSKGDTGINLAQAASRRNDAAGVFESFDAVITPFKGPKRTYGPGAVMTNAALLRDDVVASEAHTSYQKARELLKASDRPAYPGEINRLSADLTAYALAHNEPIEVILSAFDDLREDRFLGDDYPNSNTAYVTLLGFAHIAGRDIARRWINEAVETRQIHDPQSPDWQDAEAQVLMGLLGYISGNSLVDFRNYQALSENPNYQKLKFDKFMDKAKIMFLIFCKLTNSSFDEAFDLYRQINKSRPVRNDWNTLQLMLSLASLKQGVDLSTQRYDTVVDPGREVFIPTFTPIPVGYTTIYAPQGIYDTEGKVTKTGITLLLFSDPKKSTR